MPPPSRRASPIWPEVKLLGEAWRLIKVLPPSLLGHTVSVITPLCQVTANTETPFLTSFWEVGGGPEGWGG